MQRSLVCAVVFSAILGLGACSKEEPEGSAEKVGKQIDQAVESAQQQAAETRADIGAAIEEKGKEIQEQAEALTKIDAQDGSLLFAHDPAFNPGVVGLAASRLVERYYRPAVVAFEGEEFTRASCRSIPEFHITHALEQCADLLVQFGGHAAAAGFTVENKNLELLNDRLITLAEESEQLIHLLLRHADAGIFDGKI